VRSNDPACTAIAACNTSQKACNGGSADACAGLGGLYAYGVLGVTKDEAHGAALFLGACNANPSSPACIQLANLYASGTGVPKDKARALALSKRSCSAPKAVAAACSMVDSFGDHAYAIAHLRPLCDASDWSGCAYLMSDPAEKPHAIDRLHAMCSAGNTTACSHLKNMGL
jgi:TPR repeat protein